MSENKTAVAEYSATEAALADLRGRLSSVVFDVTTTRGLDEAKKARAEVRTLRTSLEDKRKEIKAPALAYCSLIDSEAKRITVALREIEEPIDAQIKAEEQRKEAEKAAKAEAERQRVAAIRARIDAMRETISVCVGNRAIDIAAAIAMLETLDTTIDGEGGFAEFAAEAEGVKQGTLTKLREMMAAAEAHEAEARILAEQRAELARQEKEAAERRAAERKAQQEEAARIRAEQEAAAAKLQAEREEFERHQAEARRKADEERAEADRKAEAERGRVQRIHGIINTIKLAPLAVAGYAAEKIARMRQKIEATAIDESFGEFAQEAEVAKAAALESLQNMHGVAVAHEAEAVRLEQQRQEQERIRQEQEARERAEREKVEAEEQARRRRAQIAAMNPPTAQQITQLVADHFAIGDYDTAANWLAATKFPVMAIEAAA